MNSSTTVKRARGTRWCQIGTGLLIFGAVMLFIGLGGSRIGLLSSIGSFMFFGFGFMIVAIAGLATTGGIVISMGTAGDASAARSWSTLAISVIIIGAALSQRPDTSGTAPIHDITTDTDNPPLFDAIVPLRADAQNPPGYSGGDTADQQQAAYPDLVTLVLDHPADEVFTAAEQVARDLGWEVVAADPSSGRIEATDTTMWFRFKDDVVIRLTPTGSGTLVDVRSKSRVGMGDMGTNARRIRTFLDQLKNQTGQ